MTHCCRPRHLSSRGTASAATERVRSTWAGVGDTTWIRTEGIPSLSTRTWSQDRAERLASPFSQLPQGAALYCVSGEHRDIQWRSEAEAATLVPAGSARPGPARLPGHSVTHLQLHRQPQQGSQHNQPRSKTLKCSVLFVVLFIQLYNILILLAAKVINGCARFSRRNRNS